MVKRRYTMQGVHLFDRESGINVLLEETKCPRSRLSIAPANVSIALWNRCNRNCIHCFAPKNEAELGFEEICRWLDELDANDCLGVGFGGGEPLLYPRIADLCRYVHDNTRMACTLTSNGDLIDDSSLEWLCGRVNFVRISTNGVDIDFGKITKLTSRLQVGINYLLNENTFQSLPQKIDECKNVGIREMLLLPQIKTARCRGVDDEFISRVDAWLLERKTNLRITMSGI